MRSDARTADTELKKSPADIWPVMGSMQMQRAASVSSAVHTLQNSRTSCDYWVFLSFKL